MKSVFAIRYEDALRWQDASNEVVGIAARAGYETRPKPGWNTWQVWATAQDFADLKSQLR
jgi:hypothetical protein